MYQKVFIVGRLGGDPELRYTPDGTPVCNMSVATNENYTTKAGEQRSTTVWFKVTAWQNLAEICAKHLYKSSKVFIEGRLKANDDGNPTIFTKKDGTPAANYEVTAAVVKFLDPKPLDRPEKEEASIEDISF
jgi:single-strand DNA-binding protein